MKPIEDYHPSHCDKYEVLRGIYPNNRRLTGENCSCGFEDALTAYQVKVEQELLYQVQNLTKTQIKRMIVE